MLAIDPNTDLSRGNVEKLAAELPQEVTLADAKHLLLLIQRWKKGRRFLPLQWEAFSAVHRTVAMIVSQLVLLQDPEAEARDDWQEANESPCALWGGLRHELETLATRL